MIHEEYDDWKTVATADPTDNYPIGSIAILAAPYPVDAGLYIEGKTVDRFVKRSAGGGRWVSYPGGDVYYNTLAGLMLDAQVAEVIVPETGDPEELPELEAEIETTPEPDTPLAQPEPQTIPQAARKHAPWLLAAGALALWLLTRRR